MLSDCFKAFPHGSLDCSHPEAGRWRGPGTKRSYSHSTELAKVKAECLFPSGFASNKWLHPKSWFLWTVGVWKNVLLFLLVVCCSSPIPSGTESPRYVVDELAKARLYSRNASSSAWALPRHSPLISLHSETLTLTLPLSISYVSSSLPSLLLLLIPFHTYISHFIRKSI